jgi:tRNA (guanine10-N2)-dimethyltransferase
VVSLETDVSCVKDLIARSSLTRAICIELFRCPAIKETILDEVRNLSSEFLPKRGESYSVRIKRVKGSSSHLDIPEMERVIGSLFFHQTDNLRVRFIDPLKPYLGVLTNGMLFFGLKLGEVDSKQFTTRKPKKRPFFHPTALTAKLARCMVNLSRAKRGNILLDPFCGTGTILLEAGMIGCKPIGVDIKASMVKGTVKNVRSYGIEETGLIISDARMLPLKRVDCISTDPPYGRSSTTMGLKIGDLLSDFLYNLKDVIKKDGFISIAAPIEVEVGNMGRDIGYVLVESYQMRVHRSLTREIAVLKAV